MAEDGKESELDNKLATTESEAKPTTDANIDPARSVTKHFVSGTLTSPVSPKFLLIGLFATFFSIAGLLLFANYFSGVAAFIDAGFFQLILTLLTCFVIGVFVFGFTAGATAQMRISPGTKHAIDFGGAIAAVAGLFWIVLPNLTPTTRLTVYLRDGNAAPNTAQSGFSVPDGVEVVLQLAEGRTAKTVITEAQFGNLPKGVDMPVGLAGPQWNIVGIDPPACVAVDTGALAIKAGCRTIWLRLTPSRAKTFTKLADLPASGLGFGDRQDVSLRTAIDALASELQKLANERDTGVYVARPDWTAIGAQIADASFAWRPISAKATACVFVKSVEQAFNDAHPDAQVFVALQISAIQVQRKQAGGVRPNDTCG
jgi:hypothetical protein